MNIFDLLSGGASRMGGAIGAALQPIGNQMGSGTANPETPMAGNKVMQKPEFASALTRLGMNLMSAGGQGGDFLSNLGQAGGATIQQMDKLRMDNQSIAESQAKLRPQAPFSGDGFDNQAAATQYQYYVTQGVPDMEARQRAVNDVLASKPQMQMVTDQAGNARMVPVPRPTLPMGPQSMSVPQQTPQVNADVQGGMPPQPTLTAPAGGLLPPPAVSGVAGDPSVFSNQIVAPIVEGNPKATQIGAEEAVKANIGTQQANITKRKELEETIRLGKETIGLAANAFTPTGLPVSAKQGIARITGAGGQVQDQLVATAQIQSLTPQMLAPMLKKLTGDGPVANAERAAAEKVFSDANSTPQERIAVLQRLISAREADLAAMGGNSLPAANSYRDMNDDELMKAIMGGQ